MSAFAGTFKRMKASPEQIEVVCMDMLILSKAFIQGAAKDGTGLANQGGFARHLRAQSKCSRFSHSHQALAALG